MIITAITLTDRAAQARAQNLSPESSIQRGRGLVGNQKAWPADKAIAIITRCLIPQTSRADSHALCDQQTGCPRAETS